MGTELDSQSVGAAAVVVEENPHLAILAFSGGKWTRKQPGCVSRGVGSDVHEVTGGFVGGVVSLGQAGQSLVSACRQKTLSKSCHIGIQCPKQNKVCHPVWQNPPSLPPPAPTFA